MDVRLGVELPLRGVEAASHGCGPGAGGGEPVSQHTQAALVAAGQDLDVQVGGLVDAVGEALPQIGWNGARALGQLLAFEPINSSAVAAWAYLRAVLAFMSSRRAVALIGSPSARRACTAAWRWRVFAARRPVVPGSFATDADRADPRIARPHRDRL
ncbi:hypothetical protein [Micromonospora sp. CB01531]|uniref:hypothetical protein n=1 Tax=Micromonospora sp. CB01531 TaxID=1718947 RepID=UPI001300CCC1|nr:hypothetical protein [Micromonospora sp. CB01531]